MVTLPPGQINYFASTHLLLEKKSKIYIFSNSMGEVEGGQSSTQQTNYKYILPLNDEMQNI